MNRGHLGINALSYRIRSTFSSRISGDGKSSSTVCRRLFTVPWIHSIVVRPPRPRHPSGSRFSTDGQPPSHSNFVAGKLSPWKDVGVSDLNEIQAKEELAHLGPVLVYHDWLYYNSDSTSRDAIPDWEFDMLERRQRAIEIRFPHLKRPDSRSERVGASPLSSGVQSEKEARGFSSVPSVFNFNSIEFEQTNDSRNTDRINGMLATPHLSPMLSLDNAMGEVELANYIGRVQRLFRSFLQSGDLGRAHHVSATDKHVVSFIGEPKLDGLSLSLRYENRILTQATTRGDGRRGDDVTAAVRCIPQNEVPLVLSDNESGRKLIPEIIEIRGEIFMPNDALKPLNLLREKNGLSPFANARNAAAGAIRQQPEVSTFTRGTKLEKKKHIDSIELNTNATKKIHFNDLALESMKTLRFRAYDVCVVEDERSLETVKNKCETINQMGNNSFPASHSEVRKMLQHLGFQVPKCVAAIELCISHESSCSRTRLQSDDTEASVNASTLSSIEALPDDIASVATEMSSCVQEMEQLRHTFGVDIDGVVFKIDNHADRRLLGHTARAPRWAIAAKFAPKSKETSLLSIECSISRTGTITPVAVLAPVTLGGATVRRASLHNVDLVQSLDLRPGDMVIVERAGDVIPHVVSRSPNAASSISGDISRGAVWSMPPFCPVCSSPVERHVLSAASHRKKNTAMTDLPGKLMPDTNRHMINSSTSATYRCTGGVHCPAQAVEGLAHFVSRRALNLGGIGRAKLQELYDLEIVRNPVDLLDLPDRTSRVTIADNKISFEKIEEIEEGGILADLDGWGTLSAMNLLESVDRARSTPLPLHRFIYALGIEGVGFATSETLAVTFGNFDAFWSAVQRLACKGKDDITECSDGKGEKLPESVFIEIPGVGGALVESLRRFGADPRNVAVVDNLLEKLNVVDDKSLEKKGTIPTEFGTQKEGSEDKRFLPLNGAHVVFTGALQSCSRTEAQQIARNAGASETPAALTKRSTHLVVGARKKDLKGAIGSKKVTKAKELGIVILTEEDFFRMVYEDKRKVDTILSS